MSLAPDSSTSAADSSSGPTTSGPREPSSSGGGREAVTSSRTRLSGSGVVATRQLGVVARFTKSIKKYLLQPMIVGFAVALGMSFGYAAYDSLTQRVAVFWKS